MTKILTATLAIGCLALGSTAFVNTAHAATGDDITCKFGCWAEAVPATQDAGQQVAASSAASLGLVGAQNALA